MINRMLGKSAVARLGALIPRRCQACGVKGYDNLSNALCPKCIETIILPPANICSVCGRPLEFEYEIDTQTSYMCGDCLEKPPLYERNIYALSYYGPVRKLIHGFKFHSKPYLAKTLATTGKDILEPWLIQQTDALIIPVPLARRKLYERGYNHAYLLAIHFGRWADLEVAEGNLQRIRDTQPQFGLEPAQRRKNVRGAFRLRYPEQVRGRVVILVDDIFTTGATIEECCRALLKAKPKEILVACLCRAGFS